MAAAAIGSRTEEPDEEQKQDDEAELLKIRFKHSEAMVNKKFVE